LEKRCRIAGAGICCLDHIVVSPRVSWGDTAYVTAYRVQGGGLVGTALVACARLGARCAVFSLLGDDVVAAQVESDLRKEGIATGGIVKVSGAGSPFSFVHVDHDSGERTIFHRGDARLVWPGSTDLAGVAHSDALLVDHYFPDLALAAAKTARAAGTPVVADAVPGADTAALLEMVDVLIAPRHFARDAGLENDLDKALDAIHAYGPSTAVITLGARGWVYSGPTGRGRGEAFEVDVVDTTGAGDVFHGAFAYGLARGWSTPRCGEFAAAVAALKCTRVGGRSGIPDLSRTLAFLRTRRGSVWDDCGDVTRRR